MAQVPPEESELRARLEQALPCPQSQGKIAAMLPWFHPALTVREYTNPPHVLRDFSHSSYHPGAKQWIAEAGLLPLAQQMQLARRDLAAARMIELWTSPTYQIPDELCKERCETFETSLAFTQAYRVLSNEPFLLLQKVGPADVYGKAIEILYKDPDLLETTRSGYFTSWKRRLLATELPADQLRWAAVHLQAYKRMDATQLKDRTDHSQAIDFTKTHEESPELDYQRLSEAGIYEQACQAWLKRYEQALRWWEGNSALAIAEALASERKRLKPETRHSQEITLRY
jgi:hypothetical protein